MYCFFSTGLKDFGVLRVSVSLLAIVRLPRDLLKNCLTTPEGKGTPLPFGVPANHLASFFFPLPMSGDPRSLRCEHLRDPHSLLTVTFWLLDNVSSTGGEYHSYLVVFVSYHVTQWKSALYFKDHKSMTGEDFGVIKMLDKFLKTYAWVRIWSSKSCINLLNISVMS